MHQYKVVVQTPSGEQECLGQSDKPVEEYAQTLLTGQIDVRSAAGEMVRVTPDNLVALEEVSGVTVMNADGQPVSDADNAAAGEQPMAAATDDQPMAGADELLNGESEDLPCSSCGTIFPMHSGSNVCPQCGERTFLPPPESPKLH